MTRWLTCLAIGVIACGQAAQPATPTPAQATAAPTVAATQIPTAAPTATPKPKFPHGLYVVKPSLQHPGGTLEVIDGDGPLPVQVEFVGIGYDVNDDFVIGTTGPNDGLMIYGADGSKRTVLTPGIFGLGRPSLSPDGTFAVVQATATPIDPAKPLPLYITDYVIDLSNGTSRRLIPPGTATVAEGRELPKWFPSGDRILYQTNFFPNGEGRPGCDVVRIVNATDGTLLGTINDRGPDGCWSPTPGNGVRFHAEVSLDSSLIVIPGQMQIYDARTLALVADVRAQTLAGLAASGYKPDARFPGQGNGGTFPLDGTFTPDKKAIVFDGAVEKNGTFGVILAKINVDGTGFTVLRPPVEVTPMFSNNHNFSQVLPRYR